MTAQLWGMPGTSPPGNPGEQVQQAGRSLEHSSEGPGRQVRVLGGEQLGLQACPPRPVLCREWSIVGTPESGPLEGLPPGPQGQPFMVEAWGPSPQPCTPAG